MRSALSWVQNAYTLAFGGLLLLGARAGDLLGRRRMFIVGLALFTLASLAIGVAPNEGWLIAARVVQGIGAATLAPSTLALLTATFPEGSERTRAVAYYGAMAGVGGSLGLVLGGLLTSWLSWRVGFFLNVPIGVAMMLAAPRFLPETTRRSGDLDVLGAMTSTIGMTGLVFGVVRAADAGWADPLTVATLVGGVLLLAGFVVNESRAPQPIMPLHLFADRVRAGAYGGRLLFLGAMMGFWFFITQFLQSVYGYSALQAGLAFLPLTITNFGVALATSTLTRRFGNGPLLAIGVAATLIGMAWLSRLSADSSYLLGLALPMLLIGAGQGAALGPFTAAGITGVTPENAGAASGLINVAHQLGGSVGLAVVVTAAAGADAGRLDAANLLAHQVSVALTVSTGMLAVALVLVVALVARPGRQDLPGSTTTARPAASNS
jgi:EmrB/QacA subfamily drug resistance transporter